MSFVDVELPDGRTVEIDVPEGADPKAVIPNAVQRITETEGGQRSYGEAALQGLKNIPGAIWGGLQQIGEAATTAPDPNQDRLARLMEVLKGVGSGLTGGIWEPAPAQTEAEAAQRTLGAGLGYAVPFSGAIKLARMAGAPTWLANLLAGGGLAAAPALVEGEPQQALENAVTGAGVMSILPAATRMVQEAAG